MEFQLEHEKAHNEGSIVGVQEYRMCSDFGAFQVFEFILFWPRKKEREWYLRNC
jgi:hypothetical protein